MIRVSLFNRIYSLKLVFLLMMKEILEGPETSLEIRVAARLMQQRLVLCQLLRVVDLVERCLTEPILQIKVESCFGNKVSKEVPLTLSGCEMANCTHIVICYLDVSFAFIQETDSKYLTVKSISAQQFAEFLSRYSHRSPLII
jgi:hypothetical protein